MVGEVLCLGNGNYEWIINDFISVFMCDNQLRSSTFYFNDWKYILALNILKEEVTLQFDFADKEILNSQLRMNTKSRGLTETGLYEKGLYVEIGMHIGFSGVKKACSGIFDRPCHLPFTVKRWMSSSDLDFYRRSAGVLLNRTLSVYCKLSTVYDAQENLLHKKLEPNREEVKEENNAPGTDVHESLTSDSTGSPHREIMLPNNKCLEKLIEDLESLLSSDDDSDVILKVQGKEFPAHKNILRARSPVFKSMFSHSMLEKESGVANLNDCNPDSFPDFLKYLYTGNTEHISLQNVFDLYTVSDKYCIDELKVDCSLFIRRNLSVETFCDTIILGLRHSEKELIKAATDFFCRCAAEIVKTPKWKIFLRENLDAGNELFIKSLSSK